VLDRVIVRRPLERLIPWLHLQYTVDPENPYLAVAMVEAEQVPAAEVEHDPLRVHLPLALGTFPGTVWEIKAPCQPRVGFLDGYVTLDFQDWHCHLCIGQSKAASPEVARHRRTSRAELYRRLNPDLQPTSWGFRMFNGGGEQQITILLPNPHLDDDQGYAPEPDWTRLYLWNRLRRKYLNLGPDPTDQTAPRFYHG
jgi:hypothetical protein